MVELVRAMTWLKLGIGKNFWHNQKCYVSFRRQDGIMKPFRYRSCWIGEPPDEAGASLHARPVSRGGAIAARSDSSTRRPWSRKPTGNQLPFALVSNICSFTAHFPNHHEDSRWPQITTNYFQLCPVLTSAWQVMTNVYMSVFTYAWQINLCLFEGNLIMTCRTDEPRTWVDVCSRPLKVGIKTKTKVFDVTNFWKNRLHCWDPAGYSWTNKCHFERLKNQRLI